MKEFRLSTSAERIAGVLFSVAAAICFGLLVYALRSQLWLMILCGLGALLIVALLILYVLNALSAACVVDVEHKKVEVKGFPGHTVDVSGAVSLQTLPKSNGQTTMRVLVFSDAEENIVAKIPTMFTFQQGKMAEPVAEEMAKVLGLEFKRNIPEWEFDKKLYEEHMKQVAAEEKAEAKKRRKARMAYRINKIRNRK